MTDLRREGSGLYLGVTTASFPFPVEFVLVRQALDDPITLDQERPE